MRLFILLLPSIFIHLASGVDTPLSVNSEPERKLNGNGRPAVKPPRRPSTAQPINGGIKKPTKPKNSGFKQPTNPKNPASKPPTYPGGG